MMDRKKFIKLSGVTFGLAILPPSLYLLAPKIESYAVTLIKNQLSYLKLADGSVEAFVSDYLKATGNDLISRSKWKTLYYLRYNWEQSERVKDLIKYYLLSSDFFINKADENSTVNYMGLFDPYKTSIPNPYSSLLHPPSEIPDAP